MRKICSLLLLAQLSVTGSALADTNVYARKKQLGLLEQYRDNYYMVKDRSYLSSTGIVVYLSKWTEDAARWAARWTEVVNKIQAVQTAGQLSSQSTAINDLLSKQEFELRELKRKHADFADRARRIRQLLHRYEIPFTQGDLYDNKIQELVNANNALENQLNSLEATALQRMNRADAISVKALDKISLKIQIIRASSSPADKDLIDKVKDLVEAAKVLEPYRIKQDELRNAVLLERGAKRYFSAQTRLQAMRDLRQQVADEFPLLNNISLAERDRVEGLVNDLLETTRIFLEKTKPDQIPDLTWSYARTSASTARRLCKVDPNSINCNLANWLDRIPASKFKTYSLDKMQAVEQAWTAALGGNGQDSMDILDKLQGRKDIQ